MKVERNNMYQSSLVEERNTFTEEIHKFLPDIAKGIFIYECCGHLWKKTKDNYLHKKSWECPKCISKIWLSVVKEETVNDLKRSVKHDTSYTRSGYDRKMWSQESYGEKDYELPSSFATIRELITWQRQNNATISGQPRCSVYLIWDKQEEYQIVKNILWALNIENMFHVEEDEWWDRREF